MKIYSIEKDIKLPNHLIIKSFFAITHLLIFTFASAQYYPQNYFQSPLDTPIYLSATFGSLRENLSLAKPDATSEEIKNCLASVDALEWAEALPQGLETELGTTGFSLTPAQAQQLALARLVLSNPHTLVLDEATALLDPRAARHLERSMSAVMSGRTVIAIAHRLHTAHDADRVCVVVDGAIAELGTHDELVALNGQYASLWRSWRNESQEGS